MMLDLPFAVGLASLPVNPNCMEYMSFGEKIYPSKRSLNRFTCPSISVVFILSPNVISAIFCIRNRMVVLNDLSLGLNEMPLPTSMLGILAIYSSISLVTILSIHFRNEDVSPEALCGVCADNVAPEMIAITAVAIIRINLLDIITSFSDFYFQLVSPLWGADASNLQKKSPKRIFCVFNLYTMQKSIRKTV